MATGAKGRPRAPARARAPAPACLALLLIAAFFGAAAAAAGDGNVTLTKADFASPWTEFVHDTLRDDVHFTISASSASFITETTTIVFICANTERCGNAANGEAVLALNASKLARSTNATKCVFDTAQLCDTPRPVPARPGPARPRPAAAPARRPASAHLEGNCTLSNALVSCLPTFTFGALGHRLRPRGRAHPALLA
eukprot:tig00020951_g16458.t1